MTDFLDVDGTRLEVKWWGKPGSDGKAIVLLHEGLGCVAMWRDVPERLADATGLPVFAYSRAGYGKSAPAMIPRPFDYLDRESYEILPHVLEQAGIRNASIIGHSDGGHIALMAAAHPTARARISRIVTLAAHAFIEDITVSGLLEVRKAYGETRLRDKLGELHGENVDTVFYGWNDIWTDPAFRNWSLEPLLSAVDVPVMVIQGSEDEYATTAQVDAIASGVSGPVETWLVPGSRHAPHLDNTDAVLDRITGFVTETRVPCSAA